MNFFNKKPSGYTLFEVIITISITTFFLIIGYRIHQNQSRKTQISNHYLGAKKECLDVFMEIAPFIYTSTCFIQKNPQTLELKMIPDEKFITHNATISNNNGIPKRDFTIQLNGKFRNKNTLNVPTKHIHAFSCAYWNSSKNKWQTFTLGQSYPNKTYPSIDFVKITFFDEHKNILDTFVFSCCLSNCNE